MLEINGRVAAISNSVRPAEQHYPHCPHLLLVQHNIRVGPRSHGWGTTQLEGWQIEATCTLLHLPAAKGQVWYTGRSPEALLATREQNWLPPRQSSRAASQATTTTFLREMPLQVDKWRRVRTRHVMEMFILNTPPFIPTDLAICQICGLIRTRFLEADVAASIVLRKPQKFLSYTGK